MLYPKPYFLSSFKGFSELLALEKIMGRIHELSQSFREAVQKKGICSNHGLYKLFSERQLFHLGLGAAAAAAVLA